MKKVIYLLFFISLVFTSRLSAQGTAYSLKGGLTIATQKWNSFDRQALLKPHIILGIESISEYDEFSLFAQIGYHTKGSAIRNTNVFNPNTNNIFQPTYEFLFHNVSLSLGAKQKFDFRSNNKLYYILGVRLDYTVNTNLSDFNEQNAYCPIFPLDSPDFINSWNYGVIFGGGWQFPFSDYIEGFIEFTVNPDFSFQYRQPEIGNIICRSSFNSNQNYTIQQREIRNLTFEITVGCRFLHKVEYID